MLSSSASIVLLGDFNGRNSYLNSFIQLAHCSSGTGSFTHNKFHWTNFFPQFEKHFLWVNVLCSMVTSIPSFVWKTLLESGFTSSVLETALSCPLLCGTMKEHCNQSKWILCHLLVTRWQLLVGLTKARRLTLQLHCRCRTAVSRVKWEGKTIARVTQHSRRLISEGRDRRVCFLWGWTCCSW